jgi:hypothetical protein
VKILLPIILGLSGLSGGLLAGHMLRTPDPLAALDASAVEAAPTPPASSDFVPLEKQFIVPVVEDSQVGSLIVVSLSLEVEDGAAAAVGENEPKLRDRFLSAMFQHAESGAFSGVFTSGPAMADLRGALLEAAREVIGPVVRDVLLTDIFRQDLKD